MVKGEIPTALMWTISGAKLFAPQRRSGRGSRGSVGRPAHMPTDSLYRSSNLQLAAASAAFGVQPVQGFFFLIRSESGEIDVGKLGSIGGILEEDLAGVGEGLDAAIEGKAREGADFAFIDLVFIEPGMPLDHAALRIDEERSGQGGHAAG